MDFRNAKTSYSFTIGYQDYEQMNSIRLIMSRGMDPLEVDRITFRSNHYTWAEMKPQETLDKKNITESPLAKEVTVTIYFRSKPTADSFGSVEIL